MFEISAKFNTNLENLILFLENETSIFVGNSGSGKSTLTSALTGTHILSKELSNNQGVHTTSVSTLYEAENQMKVIDSPGSERYWHRAIKSMQKFLLGLKKLMS